MKTWIGTGVLLLASLNASAAIIYQGELEDGVVHTGVLESESGWSESYGGWVDFWAFEGTAGEEVLLQASSTDTDLAFSVYSGTPDEFSQPFWFDNQGDWDLFSFVALSSTVGDELLKLVLPGSGAFTLVLGGEVAPMLAEGDGPWGYQLTLSRAQAVTSPGSFGLLGLGLAGLGAMRIRKHRLSL